MTTPRTDAHLDFLDRLRGVAILGVFLYHCYGQAFGWSPDCSHLTLASVLSPLCLGACGVSIFFAVSGFCIHLSHQRSRQRDFTTFFTRRFFRIYPPYFAALLLFSFVYPWHVVHLHDGDSRVQFVSHLFLVHNLSAVTNFGINGAFWSIATEVQLYLLYPLLLVIARSWTWTGALWITALLKLAIRAWSGICTALYHTEPSSFIANSPFGFWFSWAIGAALADAYLKGTPLPFARVPLWVFPLVALVASTNRHLESFTFSLAALATVSFMIRQLKKPQPEQPSRFSLWQSHLRFAGKVSYSFYLLHVPILILIADRVSRTRFNAEPFVCFLVLLSSWLLLLPISWCFYRALELPSIALGKRILQTSRPSSSQPPS